MPIVDRVGPPVQFLDRIWNNYASRMSPDEFLKSEPLWSSAQQVSDQMGMSYAGAFAHVANAMFSRMGANRHLTDEAARRFIARERGIGLATSEGETLRQDLERYQGGAEAGPWAD